jgi:hypothetical protein
MFHLRIALAGNHQLWQMEDGPMSSISNTYSFRRGRRQPPTSEVKELQFAILNVM